MRIYLDTEFIEDGRTIELLSIGLIREDGATYYAETPMSELCRKLPETVPEWIRENVLPYLTGDVRTFDEIRRDIIDFVGPEPEFWAWYAAYDWVALCQLYGRMIDLPKTWPMFCRDFRQAVSEWGLDNLPKQDETDGPEHNALSDAKWLKRAMEWYSHNTYYEDPLYDDPTI